MKITQCITHQYALPLIRPLTTGDQDSHRRGIVLTLETNTGLRGYGEIAPLAGLHHETLAQAARQLCEYLPRLSQMPVSNEMPDFNGKLSQGMPSDLFPSVRSGIEMAILDLLLQADPAWINPPASIPVNALCIADSKTLVEEIDSLLSQGFSSIALNLAGGFPFGLYPDLNFN